MWVWGLLCSASPLSPINSCNLLPQSSCPILPSSYVLQTHINIHLLWALQNFLIKGKLLGQWAEEQKQCQRYDWFPVAPWLFMCFCELTKKERGGKTILERLWEKKKRSCCTEKGRLNLILKYETSSQLWSPVESTGSHSLFACTLQCVTKYKPKFQFFWKENH